MSWPSTDFELAVESELAALRTVARLARKVVADADSRTPVDPSLVNLNALSDALDALPEEST